ncbi:Hypothetical predicted protein [Paramuricea clavata]|uniref:Uncharacterized protein n=1 Tax=Paramuricea clavata TaxID=317549 RepID=A0A6S7GGK6_PARCT|nr:Hypothetical predicted protein [Paramuricea clavata]
MEQVNNNYQPATQKTKSNMVAVSNGIYYQPATQKTKSNMVAVSWASMRNQYKVNRDLHRDKSEIPRSPVCSSI